MKTNVWRAHQIVESDGAYDGKDVRFMTADGLIHGELRHAMNSEAPGRTRLLIDGGWYSINENSYVEVL